MSERVKTGEGTDIPVIDPMIMQYCSEENIAILRGYQDALRNENLSRIEILSIEHRFHMLCVDLLVIAAGAKLEEIKQKRREASAN